MVAAMLEQEMGRRSVAAAIRPIKDRAVASSSSAMGPITQRMMVDTLIREKHPASQPVWPKGSGTPAQGRPKSSRSLLSRDARRRHHLDQSGTGPLRDQSRGRFKPCSVRARSSGKKNHRPYAHTSQRPRSLGATRAVSQRTGEV